MLRTVEMRWFFDAEPFPVSAFFDGAASPKQRTDWYAVPCDPRCGIKTREGKLEIKLLVGPLGIRRFGCVAGRVDQWAKWSVAFEPGDVPADHYLAAAGWIAVQKERYLRCFAVRDDSVTESQSRPENGCEFEWTRLTVEDQRWWTVGFEALGEPKQLENNLRLVVSKVFADSSRLSTFREERSFAYPTWLGRVHKR